MTKDVKIMAVHQNRVTYSHTVRGYLCGSREGFKADTANRDAAASCLGAKVIGWPVRVTLNERGEITDAKVLV